MSRYADLFDCSLYHDRQKTARLLGRSIAVIALLASSVVGQKELAAQTSPAPGTVIENQATGSFTNPSDGSAQPIESNKVTVTVAEVAGIVISDVGFVTDGEVNTGDTIGFDFAITNVGNDPTQFFLPDAPSSVSGGFTTGSIQVVSYDPDGAGPMAAVDLTAENIFVPADGATTGNLLSGVANANDGSIPSSGNIVIRVSVLVTASQGGTVSVVMGDTPVPPNPNEQNQPYVAGNQDVYTVDNPDPASGGPADEAIGVPLNGDAINHRQEASDTSTTGVEQPLLDLGDAPDTYGTDLIAANSDNLIDSIGANHGISNGVHLGVVAPDGEIEARTPYDGTGDDITGTPDDEDGVATFPPLVENAESYTLAVDVNNNPTAGLDPDAYLFGWIDFDGDGLFQSDEIATATIPDGDTSAALSWNDIGTTGPNITVGTTYARFRITTEVLSDNLDNVIFDDRAVGSAADGEVEDYQVAISAIASDPSILVVKRITAINNNRAENPNDGTVLNQFVDDTSSSQQADDNNPNWPSNYLLGALNGGSAKPISNNPADAVEYSIYLLSAGGSEAKNVLVCDRIPQFTSFLPDAYASGPPADSLGTQSNQLGLVLDFNGSERSLTGASDGDAGYYFPPTVEPSTQFPNISCGGVNDNGAVVVDLGNLPPATGAGEPSNAFGTLRFQVKVD